MTTNAEDYPYDPSLKRADMAKATGPERLRWVADRGMATALANLWDVVQRNERMGVGAGFERRKEAEERERLIIVASSSIQGNHGEEAAELAQGFFNREVKYADLPRLREFLVQLQRLGIDVHTMPSRRSTGVRGSR